MLRDLAGLLAKLGRLVPQDGLVLGLGRGKRGVAALAGLGNVPHDAVELFGWIAREQAQRAIRALGPKARVCARGELAVLSLVSQLAAGLPPARGLRRSPGCPRRIARDEEERAIRRLPPKAAVWARDRSRAACESSRNSGPAAA